MMGKRLHRLLKKPLKMAESLSSMHAQRKRIPRTVHW